MAKDLPTIQREFQEALAKGSAEARAYLIDHVREFPEDLQEEVIYAFFLEGLDRAVEEQQKVNTFQQEGADELRALEQFVRQIEDRIKLRELEDQAQDHD